MVDRLMNGAPPGSIGLCSDSGWMNTALFVEWLSFFVKHVKPTKETPALLIVDNHESHRSIEALEYATSNHIVLLSVPRIPYYTSHATMR